ncbi:hypothetical protein ZIOFF_034076 [Zingiber officinale]|uniref:Uncharacterized protein n=1 Tax=Zingiber officinale TaxID=94328 RepID=A0A8J5GL60_ZINOF|nr:hypothetical protein ZIOFF_034076 [Zingiber officinale]
MFFRLSFLCQCSPASSSFRLFVASLTHSLLPFASSVSLFSFLPSKSRCGVTPSVWALPVPIPSALHATVLAGKAHPFHFSAATSAVLPVFSRVFLLKQIPCTVAEASSK